MNDFSWWNTYLNLQILAYQGVALEIDHFSDEVIKDKKRELDQYIFTDLIQHVLVIGPGGSGELRLLETVCPNAQITGLTLFSLEAEKLKEKGYTIFVGDMHNMPLPSQSQHLIFSNNVFEHALSPYIVLMECRRVLTENGILVFTVPSFEGVEGGVGPYHISCLEDKAWQELLKKTGYDIIAMKKAIGDIDKNTEYYTYICILSTEMHTDHYTVFTDLIKNRGESICVESD